MLSIGVVVSVLILLILIFVTESVILNGVFAMLCSDDGVFLVAKLSFDSFVDLFYPISHNYNLNFDFVQIEQKKPCIVTSKFKWQ